MHIHGGAIFRAPFFLYAVHVRQLAGESPVPTWWRWRVAKRKGRAARRGFALPRRYQSMSWLQISISC